MKFKPKAITYICMAGCSENTVDDKHRYKLTSQVPAKTGYHSLF